MKTSDFVLNTDVTGRTPDDQLEMMDTHRKGSGSRNPWIRDAQYKEPLILQRKPIAILNRSLLINACAFITNTLRIRMGKSTPMPNKDAEVLSDRQARGRIFLGLRLRLGLT